MNRRGFTLFEMLLAIAITVVVAAQLVMVFSELFQLERQKMWDAELATKLRVAREHLLFSAIPAEGERANAGILSASNLVWSAPHITAAFQYAKEDGESDYGENEDVSERFLVQNVDDGNRDVPPVYITNTVFFVNTKVDIVLRQDPTTGQVLESTNRAERIAVTAFGRQGDDKILSEFMDLEFFENGSMEDVRWIP